MSIYSGFATRHQQEIYDNCIESLVYVLQKRLMKFYQNQKADEDKFLSSLSKIHAQMKSMQNHKYLQPKSSMGFEPLLALLKKKQLQQASMANENCKYSDHDSFHQFQIENISRKSKFNIRPQTGKYSSSRFRNKQFKSQLKSSQTPTHYKIHGSKNILKKEREESKGSERKKSNSKSRKSVEKVAGFQTNQTESEKNDVHSLLNNYIKRAKKQCSRGYNKRKSEIDKIVKDRF